MNRRLLNEFGSIRICVDTYTDGEMCGRVYASYDAEAVEFSNAVMLLKQLQRIYDENSFPQATMKQRSFTQQKESGNSGQCSTKQDVKQKPSAIWTAVRGKKATFRIRVLFRQNASWQGNITWLEKGMEENFRSALEMLMLMDSAFVDPECLTTADMEKESPQYMAGRG